MNYGNVLPVTGAAGILIAGRVIGLDDVIAAAIVVVLAGIAAYRYGSRIGRGRTTAMIAVAGLAMAVAAFAHIAGLSWPLAFATGLAAAIAVLYGLAALAQRAAARRTA
jgi:hypothetical protein